MISNAGIIAMSYIIATILFILALGGLSNQETARRGNWYGIIGMVDRAGRDHDGCRTAALRRCCWLRSWWWHDRHHCRATRADDPDA